jgi:hypothetical protein
MSNYSFAGVLDHAVVASLKVQNKRTAQLRIFKMTTCSGMIGVLVFNAVQKARICYCHAQYNDVLGLRREDEESI